MSERNPVLNYDKSGNVQYDLAYFEHTLRKYSATAEYINRLRWEFIAPLQPETVLDFGCGCGWFRAYRPEGIVVDSFDVGPSPQTGICHERYDMVCFWDVLEHFQDPKDAAWIINKAKSVALAIPVLPIGKRLESWRHHRPGEHFWYPSRLELDEWFGKYGFERFKHGMPECPPRENIWSVIYVRDGR